MSRTTDRCVATVRRVFLTRRVALRALFTIGAVAGTAGALAPILDRRGGVNGKGRTGQPGPPGRAGTGVPRPELERFAEMYRGRHIQGTAIVMVPAHDSAGSGYPVGFGGSGGSGGTAGSLGPREARAVAAVPSVEVRIDGRPLHVMRRADGSYLSLVNHYESFPTLLDVARAAVDELGTAQLSMTPLHNV